MKIKTSIGTYPNLEDLAHGFGLCRNNDAPGVARARAVVVGHVVHLGFRALDRDEFVALIIPGSYASAIRVARLLSDNVKVLPTLAK